MALCTLCSGITLEKLMPGPEMFDAAMDDEAYEMAYRHQPSFAALQSSALVCQFCSLVHEALKIGDEYVPVDEEKIRGKATQIYIRAGDVYRLDVDEPKRVALVVIDCGGLFTAMLSVFADPDDPAFLSQDVTGRRVQLDPTSDANCRMIADFVNDCMAHHPECAVSTDDLSMNQLLEESRPLPTRVLDLGPLNGSRPPYLLETQGKAGAYVALSHCWGNTKCLTTTTLNQSLHNSEIDVACLTKTFQDAIWVTRKMGLRYLWIDSLCILQDSNRDWQQESANMGTIYRNARFTIAATGAEHGEVGLFMERSEPKVAPVKLPHLLTRQGRPCNVYFGLNCGSFGLTVEKGPLQKRAWVIQERILSRRIVHFGREQIFLECQRSCVAEDGNDYLITGRLKQSLDLRYYSGPEREDINNMEHISVRPMFRRWCLIIEEYMHRDITKSKDKLPALSGLAKEIQKRTQDRYLAGFWREGLHLELLWTARFDGVLSRPPQYRAPSWSWASVDGPIRWDDYSAQAHEPTSPQFTFLGANVEPDGSDPCGAVKGGWIELCSVVKTATYVDDTAHPEDLPLIYKKRILDADGIDIGRGLLDFPTNLPTPVICLRISFYEEDRGSVSSRYGVLLIKESSSLGSFERIGAGVILAPRWFDGCEEKSLRLV